MKIREAEKKDLPFIRRMVEKEFPYVSGNINLEERLENPGTSILVAEEKGKVLGFADYGFFREGQARLNAVSVKESERGKGTGKKILREALKRIREKSGFEVGLLVKKENAAAKKLYLEVGFRKIGVHPKKLDGSEVEEMLLGPEEKETTQRIV